MTNSSPILRYMGSIHNNRSSICSYQCHVDVEGFSFETAG